MEVDSLFRASSIAAVREVETKTRHEIEEKKQQLRQVVGDSYRDLISSADTIIDISRSCHRLVDLTASLQAGLGELAGSITQRQDSLAAAVQQQPAASSYDRLYALGSRIKYLIDTPETIYGCLDGGQYLAAARRYVRAAEVHRVLTAGQAKVVAQRFPLLQHQWPLVKKFRAQVYNAAGSWLASHGELTAEQAASTLAAQALLKPMDGAEVLKAYLNARQTYIMQCLSAATSAGADTDLDSLAFILSDVATMVCATLAQCGELFLQLPGVNTVPLLAQALAAEDSSAADLLFDTGKEAETWKAHVEAVRLRLAELSAAGLALECSQWLDQVSQQLRHLGGKLLGPATSGQGLLSVEAAVKVALDAWQYSLQVSRSPADALAVQADAEPAVSMSWSDICQWVLGRPSPLWPLLFEQPLLERAKQLVAHDFTTIVDEVSGLLDGALKEARNMAPCAPGAFQSGTWSDAVQLQPGTPDAAGGGPAASSKRRRLGGQATQANSQPAISSTQANALQQWLPQAEQAVQRLDQKLQQALAAALDACGTSAQGAVPADAYQSRALVLEPFVQDRCAEAVEGIVASLDARLLVLPKQLAEEPAAAFAPTATQALILGRVALGIATRSNMLPLVMGPTDQWASAICCSSIGGGSADSLGSQSVSRLSGTNGAGVSTATAPSVRLERLQQQLHKVGLQAYSTWTNWASGGLAVAMAAALATDHTLAADTPLRAWEETVIGSGGSSGEEGGLPGQDASEPAGSSLEMRFLLPAAPSPAAVELALAACRELDRAGAHLLEDEPVLLFKWQLGASLLQTLILAFEDSTAGSNSSALDGAAAAKGRNSTDATTPLEKLSEKGVLQLLFDIRFLMELLNGGCPVSMADAAGSAAVVAARRREVTQLEALLSAKLDPIDWATYEPYLYANKDRASRRCQVLFGMLLRGDRQAAGTGAAAASGMPTDSNIVQMSPVGPRFSYLPVTAPMGLPRQASLPQLQPLGSNSQAELLRLGSGALLAGAASTTSSDGEVSASVYSFAGLLSSAAKATAAGRQGIDEAEKESSSAATAMGSGVSAAANKLVAALGDMSTQGLFGRFAK